jgi:hypothetical protein
VVICAAAHSTVAAHFFGASIATFCTKAVAAEVTNAKRADELWKTIQSAETSLVTTAGVDDVDPGAAAVVVYLAAIGVQVNTSRWGVRGC